jgi:hypothetical protein
MEQDEGTPEPGNWRDPDQPGPPLLEQLREHPRIFLSAAALVLLVGIIIVAARPLSRGTTGGSAAPSSTPTPGPPLLGLSPGLAYDPVHRQAVLFNNLGQTWLFSGSTWTAAHPRRSPAGRIGAAMAWDPKLRAVLLYGGVVGVNGQPRDTWAWDGSSWRQLGGGSGAPPGGWAGMTYDPVRGQMVLVVAPTSRTTAPTETWIWDGVRWQQRARRDQPGPLGSLLPTAFDPQSRTTLVASLRCPGAVCVSETWSWDGSNWHQLQPVHMPDPSAHMQLVQDPVSGQLLLLTEADVPQGVPAPTETWTWNGRDWTRVGPTGKPGGIVYAVSWGDGGGGAVWAFEDTTPSPGAPRVDDAWLLTGTQY